MGYEAECEYGLVMGSYYDYDWYTEAHVSTGLQRPSAADGYRVRECLRGLLCEPAFVPSLSRGLDVLVCLFMVDGWHLYLDDDMHYWYIWHVLHQEERGRRGRRPQSQREDVLRGLLMMTDFWCPSVHLDIYRDLPLHVPPRC